MRVPGTLGTGPAAGARGRRESRGGRAHEMVAADGDGEAVAPRRVARRLRDHLARAAQGAVEEPVLVEPRTLGSHHRRRDRIPIGAEYTASDRRGVVGGARELAVARAGRGVLVAARCGDVVRLR
jgi:hypothetical protein